MKIPMIRNIVVLALSVLTFAASGCGRFWMPSEKTVYDRACEAIEQSSGYLIGTKLHSMDRTSMYIGKSAGRIDIPCDLGGGAQNIQNPKYVVFMKRVARTWVVEKVYPPGSSPEPFRADNS
jgi:hypothetical protein